MEELIADQEVRVIILTGAGEKAFISGGDVIEELKMDGLVSYKWALTGHKLCSAIENSPKPVIAAINGYALGEDLKSQWLVIYESVLIMQSSELLNPNWAYAAALAEISVFQEL